MHRPRRSRLMIGPRPRSMTCPEKSEPSRVRASGARMPQKGSRHEAKETHGRTASSGSCVRWSRWRRRDSPWPRSARSWRSARRRWPDCSVPPTRRARDHGGKGSIQWQPRTDPASLFSPLWGDQPVAQGAARLCGRALGARAPMCDRRLRASAPVGAGPSRAPGPAAQGSPAEPGSALGYLLVRPQRARRGWAGVGSRGISARVRGLARALAAPAAATGAS